MPDEMEYFFTEGKHVTGSDGGLVGEASVREGSRADAQVSYLASSVWPYVNYALPARDTGIGEHNVAGFTAANEIIAYAQEKPALI